jgi:hypothetical protein
VEEPVTLIWSAACQSRRGLVAPLFAGFGGITKTGNTHVRRLLVEAAWHQRRPPRCSSCRTLVRARNATERQSQGVSPHQLRDRVALRDEQILRGDRISEPGWRRSGEAASDPRRCLRLGRDRRAAGARPREPLWYLGLPRCVGYGNR